MKKSRKTSLQKKLAAAVSVVNLLNAAAPIALPYANMAKSADGVSPGAFVFGGVAEANGGNKNIDSLGDGQHDVVDYGETHSVGTVNGGEQVVNPGGAGKVGTMERGAQTVNPFALSGSIETMKGGAQIVREYGSVGTMSGGTQAVVDYAGLANIGTMSGGTQVLLYMQQSENDTYSRSGHIGTMSGGTQIIGSPDSPNYCSGSIDTMNGGTQVLWANPNDPGHHEGGNAGYIRTMNGGTQIVQTNQILSVGASNVETIGEMHGGVQIVSKTSAAIGKMYGGTQILRGEDHMLGDGVIREMYGGTQIVSAYGFGHNANMHDGALAIAESEGVLANNTLFSGGTMIIKSNGAANQNTISAGGVLEEWGGALVGANVPEDPDAIYIHNNYFLAGAVHRLEECAAKSDYIVDNHYLVIGDGALAKNSEIKNGGVEVVSSGGASINAVISDGGTQVVSGGTARIASMDNGTQLVSGGNASVKGLNSGMQAVAGGNVSVATMNGGTQNVSGGNTSVATMNGGTQNVSGGNASVATMNSGTQNVSGGTASVATMNGGTQNVSGGTASVATMNGGTQIVSGGTASVGTLAGGVQSILSGGSGAVGAFAGGTLSVQSGGVLTNDTLTGYGAISGGANLAGKTVVASGGTMTADALTADKIAVSGGATLRAAGDVSATTSVSSVSLSGALGTVSTSPFVQAGGAFVTPNLDVRDLDMGTTDFATLISAGENIGALTLWYTSENHNEYSNHMLYTNNSIELNRRVTIVRDQAPQLGLLAVSKDSFQNTGREIQYRSEKQPGAVGARFRGGKVPWETGGVYYTAPTDGEFKFNDNARFYLGQLDFSFANDVAKNLSAGQSMRLIANVGNTHSIYENKTGPFKAVYTGGANTDLTASVTGYDAAIIGANLDYTLKTVTLNEVMLKDVSDTADTVPAGWTHDGAVNVVAADGFDVNPAFAGQTKTVLTAKSDFFSDAVIDASIAYSARDFAHEEKGATIYGSWERGLIKSADNKALIYQAGNLRAARVDFGEMTWGDPRTFRGNCDFSGLATVNAYDLSFTNPEDVTGKSTLLEANSQIADFKPRGALQTYACEPVPGVTVNALLAGKVAKSSDGQSIEYTTIRNAARKLTFGDVEWKKDGALLDHHTTMKNVSFNGAHVDTTNIRFTNIKSLAANRTMTLVSGFGDKVGKITGTKYKVGSTLEGDGRASLVGNDLIFTAETGVAQEQTHNTLMGAGAAMATIAVGNDFIGDATDGLGLASSTGSDGVSAYAKMGGGSIRQETGSHVDVHTWNAILALGRNNKSERGAFEYGAFFEYGTGNFTTHNGDLRGDGSTRYTGGGLLAKWTANHGLYVEGSLRAGRAHGEANNLLRDEMEEPYSYETNAPYWGFHLGVGKEIVFDDMHSLDVYGKYFYNQRNAVSFDAGGHYDLDAPRSQILRVGARYNVKRDKWNFYGGLAYEHEMDGVAAGTADGVAIRGADLGGGSVRAEIGASMQPDETSPWKLDLNLAGFAGKKDGLTGGLSVTFLF